MDKWFHYHLAANNNKDQCSHLELFYLLCAPTERFDIDVSQEGVKVPVETKAKCFYITPHPQDETVYH